jgi:hypothetical protein
MNCDVNFWSGQWRKVIYSPSLLFHHYGLKKKVTRPLPEELQFWEGAFDVFFCRPCFWIFVKYNEAVWASLLLFVMRGKVSRLRKRGWNVWWHNLAQVFFLQQSLEHRTLLLDFKCLTRLCYLLELQIRKSLYTSHATNFLVFQKQILYGSWWHCCKSRQVAGSIPDGVIGIFHS